MTEAASKKAITSLLTEHLRYTPLTLLDDIINTVNELVYLAVGAVETGLQSTSPVALGFAEKAAADGASANGATDSQATDEDGNPVYTAAQLEIENGVQQLETLLEATVDKNFDKLEIYVLRNILSVPAELAPWIQLRHYENVTLPPSTTSSNQPHTPESLLALRRKVQESSKLHNALVAESARNAQLISQLRTILYADPQSAAAAAAATAASTSAAAPLDPSAPSYAFLTSTLGAKVLGVDLPSQPPGQVPADPSKPAMPLTAHTSLAMTHLPTLRTLLTQLRPHAARIAQQQSSAPVSQADGERREYIEGRAKRVLEREGVDVEGGEGLVGGMDGLASRAGGANAGAGIGMDDVRGVESVLGRLEREKDREAQR